MSELDPDRRQPAQSETTLNAAAWHLQVLLSALANLDSKIMFVTALNVAGLSALIGVAVAADPVDWLFWLGLVASGLAVLLGFARLWSAESEQFPSPTEAFRTSLAVMDRVPPELQESRERIENFHIVRAASYKLAQDLRRRHWLLRALMVLSALSLVIAVAATVTALA